MTRKWTPLQEGRFHLRNKKPTETWLAYAQRSLPAVGPATLPDLVRRFQRRAALARREQVAALDGLRRTTRRT